METQQPEPKPKFDLKYWAQTTIMAAILTVCSLCLNEIKTQGEFRAKTEVKMENYDKEIAQLKVDYGVHEKRGQRHEQYWVVLNAILPEWIKKKFKTIQP